MKKEIPAKLPVLIIAYSRPKGVNSVVKTLLECGIKEIYVAIDGPRNMKDESNQNKIEEMLQKYASDSRIIINKRKHNLGVAGGVISAVDWFFSQVEMGLVLEDDLTIGMDLVRFIQTSLERYKEDENVWMISGSQFFPNYMNPKLSVWCNYPIIWGWAGWAKKWKEMRSLLLEKKPISVKQILDRRYLFWAIGANRALSGKIDTWDIPLAFEFIQRKKLCLLPPVNLVSNIGADDVATHTKFFSRSMNQPLERLDTNYYYPEAPLTQSIASYSIIMEQKIYKIGRRHFFIPYYSFLLDHFRYSLNRRNIPLKIKLSHLNLD